MENNSYRGKIKPITPPISLCYCGANATMHTIDIGQEVMGRLQCTNGHVLTKYCFYHRAVMLWNNRVEQKRKQEWCTK